MTLPELKEWLARGGLWDLSLSDNVEHIISELRAIEPRSAVARAILEKIAPKVKGE